MYERIEAAPERIGSTHFYDHPSKKSTRRVLPGCGLVDIPGFTGRLLEKGFQGAFNLETTGTFEEQDQAVLALDSHVARAVRSRDV